MIDASAGGVRVIRPEDRKTDFASGAMQRQSAVSRELVGATGLWFGFVRLEPQLVSAPHHHEHAESGIYVISGRLRLFVGDDLDEIHDAEAGDFIWVPAHVVHVEANPSLEEPVAQVVARSTPDNLVKNLRRPPGWTPDLT